MMSKLFRGLLWVPVLVAAFYLVENWRGKHAWMKYQREREAKGDRFEWSTIVPPPVPDAQNAAAALIFAELFPKSPEHPRYKALELPDPRTPSGNWRCGRREDLDAWKKCFTNDDLLAALTRYEPILHELETALQRPRCRFPIRYEDNFSALLPHLSVLRKAAGVYRLCALAELTAGQTDAALTNVQQCLRLADANKDEPLLISQLVHIRIIASAIQPVWEGLMAHRWNDAQLAAIQVEFGKFNQFDQLLLAYQGERMMANSGIQWVNHNRDQLVMLLIQPGCLDSSPSWSDREVARAIPSGWFYQNALSLDRFYTERLMPAIDFSNRRLNPSKVDEAFQIQRLTPFNLLMKMLAAGEGRIACKFALSQVTVDEVLVACAIERYRLAHGSLPESLTALVPQFLDHVPHDPIDGQPLRYKRTPADQFVLYSIGWNAIDDGGRVVCSKQTYPLDDTQADWVWMSEPSETK